MSRTVTATTEAVTIDLTAGENRKPEFLAVSRSTPRASCPCSSTAIWCSPESAASCRAEVLTSGSVSEAPELLKTQKLHVVISDIGMPEIDGYQFIRQVRGLPAAEGGNVPAIALTAFARSEDRARAMMAGYQTHIAKPVEPRELIATVASFAGRTATRDSK